MTLSFSLFSSKRVGQTSNWLRRQILARCFKHAFAGAKALPLVLGWMLSKTAPYLRSALAI